MGSGLDAGRLQYACEFVRWDFAMHFATAHELLKALQGIGATTIGYAARIASAW
jgi:adenine-specific DNA glycosylase